MQPQGSYSDTAGLRLLAELPESGVFRTSDALAAGSRLGLTQRHVHQLLYELARSGWLARLQHGLYAPVDRATDVPRAHPFTIGTSLVEPAAVSHWSALAHWELTEQIPQVVTVSSPTRTAARGRRRQARSGASGRLWLVGGQRYRVVFVRPEHYFGVSRVWVTPSEQVSVYDRERALLDAFRHFHVFGSLAPALEMVEQHLPELDLDRLVDYAGRLGVAAVVRRLGWLLERLGAPEAARARLHAQLAARAGEVPLDPTRPERGPRSRKWGVIENLDAA